MGSKGPAPLEEVGSGRKQFLQQAGPCLQSSLPSISDSSAQHFSKCGPHTCGGSLRHFQESRRSKYFYDNIMTLFVFFAVLSFVLMVQMLWWVKLPTATGTKVIAPNRTSGRFNFSSPHTRFGKKPLLLMNVLYEAV